MVRHCIGFFAFLLLICGIANGAALAEPRLALVIGNSDYRDVVALPNPAKDAEAMDAFLRKAGFDVTPANNLTQSDMRRELRDFADKVTAAGPSAVALVYYAGHGVQIDGENYLIPVDASIKREADVPIAGVRLNDVMNVLSALKTKTTIVIMDACRNNPFSAIDKTIGRGLAIVDAPKGSIVSYSTSPGATALDGKGDHSPFTSALIDVARTPGLPVEQTFKKVRLEVNKATDGQQTPWESSSLISDFAFFPGQDAQAKSNEAPQQVASRDELTTQDTSEHDAIRHETRTVAMWREKLESVTPQKAYDLVIEADTVEAYEAFLTVYPKFEYVERIRVLVDRRLEMIAWYDATVVNDPIAFESFLVRYPDSDLAATARRLQERAKHRSLSPDMLAHASALAGSPAGSAASSVKIITKTVEKPVIVTKVVEKPVVVEKVVKQIVRVSGPCECTDCGRRAGGRIRIIGRNGDGYRMNYPVEHMHPMQRQSFARFSGGMKGRR